MYLGSLIARCWHLIADALEAARLIWFEPCVDHRRVCHLGTRNQ